MSVTLKIELEFDNQKDAESAASGLRTLLRVQGNTWDIVPSPSPSPNAYTTMATEESFLKFCTALAAPDKLYKATELILIFLYQHKRLPLQGEWHGPSGRTFAGVLWAVASGRPHPEVGSTYGGLDSSGRPLVTGPKPRHYCAESLVVYRNLAVERGLL